MEFRARPCQKTIPFVLPVASSMDPPGVTIVGLPSTRGSAIRRRRAPQIIEAAARVFAERGFHGATTQDIADVLGIRQASLYYYFSSKRRL